MTKAKIMPGNGSLAVPTSFTYGVRPADVADEMLDGAARVRNIQCDAVLDVGRELNPSQSPGRTRLLCQIGPDCLPDGHSGCGTAHAALELREKRQVVVLAQQTGFWRSAPGRPRKTSLTRS